MVKYITRGKADYIWGLLRNRLPELSNYDVNINQRGADVHDVTFKAPALTSEMAEVLNAIKVTQGVDWTAYPLKWGHYVEVIIS